MKRTGEGIHVSGLNWHLGAQAANCAIGKMLSEGRDPREATHEIVKSNPYRHVIRIESNGSAFFLKQHNETAKRGRVGSLFLPRKAQSEWEALNRMRLLGFETPVPVAVAYGKTGSDRVSILVTSSVKDASNLREALESLDQQRRLVLAKSLGAQLRVLHERGVYHRDMQPGNFFVKPAGDGFKFYFLDLHKAVFTVRVSLRRRVKDLGQLVFNLLQFCDNAVIGALLAGYAGNMPAARLYKRAMRQAAKLQVVRKRSRARRCLKNSTRFALEKTGNLKIYRSRDLSLDEVLAILKEFKSSKRKTIETGEFTCHIKEIESKGLWQNFKDLFQKSRGRRAWYAGNALTVRKIPTPRSLALVEERFAGLLRRSYLITEFVTPSQTLAEYVHERFVMDDAPPQEINAFLRNLVSVVASLYKESIYHSDLKASNILVKSGPDKPPELFITDLDGIQLWRKPHPQRIVKNLAQLYCSVPFCVARPRAVRFFVRFIREAGLGPDFKSKLWQIIDMAEKRRQRWIAIVRKYGRIM